MDWLFAQEIAFEAQLYSQVVAVCASTGGLEAASTSASIAHDLTTDAVKQDDFIRISSEDGADIQFSMSASE